MYYDNDNDEEEDKEALSYDKAEGNDDDDDEMAAHGLPMADSDEVDNDDDGDEMGGQVDAPVDLAQPPDNPPGEITGVEVADQDKEHEEPICPEIPGVNEEEPEIPGVNEEETKPEIPGVGVAEENEAVENGDDQPIQVKVMVEPPPTPPEAENNLGGWYNLRGGRSRNYNHRYTGKDFVIDNENGIIMTTEGTSEVLETLQMSLKAGL